MAFDITLSGGTTGFDISLTTAAPPSNPGYIKVWNGSSFVQKPVKIWNGTSWAIKPMKRWNGSSWVDI